MEVHNDGGGSNLLWYHVGVVNPTTQTIAWGPSVCYDNGWYPSVAVYNGKVWETHYDGALEGNLWEHVGYLSGTSLTLSAPSYYDSGQWQAGGPSIAADKAGVASIHDAGTDQSLHQLLASQAALRLLLRASVHMAHGSPPASDCRIPVRLTQIFCSPPPSIASALCASSTAEGRNWRQICAKVQRYCRSR